jgi:hypothetical protein
MHHHPVCVILAACLLACGGKGETQPGSPGATTDASSASSCQQQVDEGGVSLAQCTCASMVASAASGTTVLAVYATTSDAINANYDLGLPAGTPVCFVAESGEFTHSAPPGGSTGPSPYAFVIYTESPWSVVESGSGSTLPTPSSD